MSSSGLLLRLREREAFANPAEKNVVTFVLREPQLAAGMTVRALAEQTFSSPSTVIRLCRKLGFTGFKQFQRELMLELAFMDSSDGAPLEDVSQGDDAAQIVSKVMRSNVRSIEATGKLIDPATLEYCADLLKRARMVNLFGIGASRLAAHDLAQKLMRADKLCSSLDDSHDQLLSAKNMHQNDVAVVFSYSGETREMVDCAQCAHDNGARIVAITRIDADSELVRLADAVLGVAASEPIVRSGAMASRMAQLMVVDALYATYVAKDYRRATASIKRNYIEK